MKRKTMFAVCLGISIAMALVSCSEYKKTDGGLQYKFYVQNKDAQKPELGDVMTVMMQWKLQDKEGKEGKDSVLFNSNGNSQPLMLLKPIYKGDISEGLALMSVGDSACFIVNADSFYMKNIGMPNLPEYIKPNSNIIIDVKLISIQKKAEFEKEKKMKMEKINAMIEERKAKEPEELKKYLKDNKINTKPTATGLYYIETLRGTGAKAANGKTVKVHYTLKLLDGNLIESSVGKEPISFVLGTKQVIPGWEEGIAMMKVGGKAKLIIPSNIAYGENGSGTAIMPYTPLYFEVELVEVK